MRVFQALARRTLGKGMSRRDDASICRGKANQDKAPGPEIRGHANAPGHPEHHPRSVSRGVRPRIGASRSPSVLMRCMRVTQVRALRRHRLTLKKQADDNETLDRSRNPEDEREGLHERGSTRLLQEPARAVASG